jgi:hypothetical protein
MQATLARSDGKAVGSVPFTANCTRLVYGAESPACWSVRSSKRSSTDSWRPNRGLRLRLVLIKAAKAGWLMAEACAVVLPAACRQAEHGGCLGFYEQWTQWPNAKTLSSVMVIEVTGC